MFPGVHFVHPWLFSPAAPRLVPRFVCKMFNIA
jgi:hypothetical protein